MTKTDLAEKIKRRLGYPMIKIELDISQIFDSIDLARQKYIKWAAGSATQEVFFTIPLSGGQNFYDMPVGVTEIIRYSSNESTGGINTLFTIDNYFYNMGMYDGLLKTTGAYTLIDYHIAHDFMESVDRYVIDRYNWKYHKFTNQLEIHPAPTTGNSLEVLNASGGVVIIDSPGFIMLQAYMVEGSTYNGWQPGDSNENFYDIPWVFEYSYYQSMGILGLIRRKFANFNSIGNVGISMDGDSLINESNTMIEKLEETLREEEISDGYPILIG